MLCGEALVQRELILVLHVEDGNGLPGADGLTGDAAFAKGCPLRKRTDGSRRAVMRRRPERMAVYQTNGDIKAVAKASRIAGDRIQDRLEVGGGAADDLQDLGGDG